MHDANFHLWLEKIVKLRIDYEDICRGYELCPTQ